MESRIALVGIVVSNHDSVPELNALLSQYGEYIVGRMGIPYREKKVSIISIAMDAPNDVISALSGAASGRELRFSFGDFDFLRYNEKKL